MRRRGTATVVGLVGEVRAGVPEAAARARNVALVAPDGEDVEAALRAMERAEGATRPYVLVPADPLKTMAKAWRALWTGTQGRPDEFERAAGGLLAAARGRLPLPDYYVVLAAEPPAESSPEPHPNDFHLGVLSSVRSARVLGIAPAESVAEDATRVVATLSALPQGPWWPPLEELITAARDFFPESLSG